jgi:hypothetical protein
VTANWPATLEAAGVVASLVVFAVGVLKANRVNLRGGRTVGVAAAFALGLSALYVPATMKLPSFWATIWQIVCVAIIAWGGALGVSWGARLSPKQQ